MTPMLACGRRKTPIAASVSQNARASDNAEDVLIATGGFDRGADTFSAKSIESGGIDMTPKLATLKPAAECKFLHDAELRDHTREKQVISQKTPKSSQTSSLIFVVVARRNVDADRDYPRTIGSKSRYHAKNCCSKAQKPQPIL
jgi:hypothetical protein